ncbi:MAG: RecR protein [candidate division CPR2 bacterium GW2011_GWC1_39_9]|uniref:Recombination protein RecR n=1 Tax=candidate division CPR2 bacterium GW2011_GWC2_39_10 TaxID=1618345 RepID=A0A0G0M3C6_UNCC2|nr:MAG: RecR protein [candidate division CPR2 bacterium GW2011_GWC2_39_10]KKR34525.1 MAG: RecR protein [candidate division CPR2 bacterium GW2011_GWC1_39_9]
MQVIPKSVQNLIDELSKLPGIGPKTAQRLVFYLLKRKEEDNSLLGDAVLELKNGIRYCATCCSLTDIDECKICSDLRRDKDVVCVVEEPMDVVAVENSGHFRGLYHVLGGAISPIEGIGPDDLNIGTLASRLGDGIKEVIIATNPNLEGEATALYLQRALIPFNVKISRLAYGLPIGADLEYADELTIAKAIEGRQELF